MTLTEYMDSADPALVYKIGAKSGFFFIGTKAEFKDFDSHAGETYKRIGLHVPIGIWYKPKVMEMLEGCPYRLEVAKAIRSIEISKDGASLMVTREYLKPTPVLVRHKRYGTVTYIDMTATAGDFEPEETDAVLILTAWRTREVVREEKSLMDGEVIVTVEGDDDAPYWVRYEYSKNPAHKTRVRLDKDGAHNLLRAVVLESGKDLRTLYTHWMETHKKCRDALHALINEENPVKRMRLRGDYGEAVYARTLAYGKCEAQERWFQDPRTLFAFYQMTSDQVIREVRKKVGLPKNYGSYMRLRDPAKVREMAIKNP